MENEKAKRSILFHISYFRKSQVKKLGVEGFGVNSLLIFPGHSKLSVPNSWHFCVLSAKLGIFHVEN